MAKSETEPDIRLPIKLDAASNGEYAPRPLGALLRRAKAFALARAAENARHLGLSRRHFLESLCGAATTLVALNEAFAAAGNTGGHFALPRGADLDVGAAATGLAGDEFILDAQTHHVDPNGAWRGRNQRWESTLRAFPQGGCGLADPVGCYSADHFIKEVFFDSDTAMAVLSIPPAPADANPLDIEDAAATRALVEAMDGSPRLLIQGMVIPNLPPQQSNFDEMERMAQEFRISSWKTYTNWGPDGGGWWLDGEDFGIPFIERARRLGVKVITVHKGLPFAGFDAAYASCRDVGVAARLFPDVNFVVYHSGYDGVEGPYDPTRVGLGIDTLIRSLAKNDIPPNANVYAELGSTWRIVMRDPTQAAHVLGKLLKYVGEDRVLWGTDSIWYGSPQDQIQAFRTFQIAELLRERYGYPEITEALRAKVLGLNALSAFRVDKDAIRRKAETDRVGRLRANYCETPRPSFITYGPRTRAEFLALKSLRAGLPG